MTDKLFKVVGTTLFRGTYKVRWATDMVTRFKMLHKGGHTDIELFDLPEPMTKQQACEWLVDQEWFTKLCEDAQYAVNAKLDEYHVVKKPVTVSLEEIAKRPTIDTTSWETVNTGTENTPEVAE
jgi:hypothetical protein